MVIKKDESLVFILLMDPMEEFVELITWLMKMVSEPQLPLMKKEYKLAILLLLLLNIATIQLLFQMLLMLKEVVTMLDLIVW